ncbi:MAG: hypothetical protein ABI142_00580 [Bryocella sp.]
MKRVPSAVAAVATMGSSGSKIAQASAALDTALAAVAKESAIEVTTADIVENLSESAAAVLDAPARRPHLKMLTSACSQA